MIKALFVALVVVALGVKAQIDLPCYDEANDSCEVWTDAVGNCSTTDQGCLCGAYNLYAQACASCFVSNTLVTNGPSLAADISTILNGECKGVNGSAAGATGVVSSSSAAATTTAKSTTGTGTGAAATTGAGATTSAKSGGGKVVAGITLLGGAIALAAILI